MKQLVARKKKNSKKGRARRNMNIKEPDQNFNLTLKMTDLGSECAIAEKNYKSSSGDDDPVQRDDANQHNKMGIISNRLRGSERECNDRNELISGSMSNYCSANRVQDEGFGEFSDYDSWGNDLTKFISRRRYTYAEDLPIIDSFMSLQLGNDELNFRFQQNYSPICMASYEVLLQARPDKYLICYFLNSEIQNLSSADCKDHMKWSNFCESNYCNRGLRKDSVYQITAQVLSTASQLKMKRLLREFQISTLVPRFYEKRDLRILASKRLYPEAAGYSYFDVSETGNPPLNRNKVENKMFPLRFFNFFIRPRKPVLIKSARINKGNRKIDHDSSKIDYDSTATCKLQLQSSHQKSYHEYPVLNKEQPKNRKLISQSEKIKRNFSVSCLSSRNNQILPEPDKFHYCIPQTDSLPAGTSKKLPVAETVKENALRDDLPPSAQIPQKTAREKRIQPTYGLSQTNVPTARNSTTLKTSCQVSLDEKHKIGLLSSKKKYDEDSEMKNKTLLTSFEVTRERAVPPTVGEHRLLSGTEAEYVSLHVDDKMAASNSPISQRTNSCNSTIILGQHTDSDETSSTQASTKAPQDLPFPCKTTESVSAMPSPYGRHKKSERARDKNSDFTMRKKREISCLLL